MIGFSDIVRSWVRENRSDFIGWMLSVPLLIACFWVIFNILFAIG